MARRALIILSLLGIMSSSALVLAQDDPAKPATADPAAATADASVDETAKPAEEPKADAEPKAEEPKEGAEVGSNEDLLNKLKEAKQAYDELRDEKEETPKKYLIAALIAALANLLLSVIKRAMKLTGKAKKVLPWASMGLGLVVGVLSYYAGGTTWMDAILYGGAAPGAIIIQELLRPIKSKDPEEANA